ncbi:MAG: UDP-N-acetylmuramoyl-tripeptide-D-alanyl-D-alanine ligase [uncultured bacterium]|nr:MAG: UDP-N-acetylmuramoyl-tripeptide-D-alanyl-D-alanine ligase [uncultured bacterium]
MLELGDDAQALHYELGQFAKEAGVQQLFCFGKLTQHTVDAFGSNAYHFETQEKLTAELKKYLNERVTVLIKGSHGMRMDKIASELCSIG